MLFWVKGPLPWSEAASYPKKTELERARTVIKIKQEVPEESLFEGYP